MALLVGMRLLTEYVPPETFGVVSLVLGIMTLGSNFLCYPILQATLRFYPDHASNAGHLRATVENILFKSTAVLAAFILLAGIACTLLQRTALTPFIIVAALVVVETFKSLEFNFLSAARRQRSFALYTAADGILRPGLAVLAVIVLGSSAEAVLAGFLAAAILLLLPMRLFKVSASSTDKAALENIELRRELWKYAMPLAPLAFIGWVSSLSDRYIIGGILGAEQVGIYAAAYGIGSRVVSFIPGVLSSTLRPVYFEAVSSKNSYLARKSLQTWALTVGVSCAFVCITVYVLRREIASLLLAQNYGNAADLLPWIGVGYSLSMLSHVFGASVYASKRTQWLLVIHGCGALASVVFGVLFICAFGVPGAAAAVPVYFGIELIVSIMAFRKCSS